MFIDDSGLFFEEGEVEQPLRSTNSKTTTSISKHCHKLIVIFLSAQYPKRYCESSRCGSFEA